MRCLAWVKDRREKCAVIANLKFNLQKEGQSRSHPSTRVDHLILAAQ